MPRGMEGGFFEKLFKREFAMTNGSAVEKVFKINERKELKCRHIKSKIKIKIEKLINI